MEPDRRKRIAVDVDGTLTKEGLFPDIWDLTPKEFNKILEEAEPDLEMIDIVNGYFDKGYIVFIFTARPDLHERVTKKWLDKYNVKYHYIVMNKPYFDCIIEDKSIHPAQLKLAFLDTPSSL